MGGCCCSWVYPRVYGESKAGFRRGRWYVGLSPRVRGIQQGQLRPVGEGGSIPACTGNPLNGRSVPIPQQVYPRVYGESTVAVVIAAAAGGLSPRVRGILRDGVVWRRAVGSIPACTGNPWPPGPGCGPAPVYPRVYGESRRADKPRDCIHGLSPRVRGIRHCSSSTSGGRGSIPACTGNPWTGSVCARSRRVYPRVYGESRRRLLIRSLICGLSPRVRGIRQVGARYPEY